jgi:hypothetical protein
MPGQKRTCRVMFSLYVMSNQFKTEVFYSFIMELGVSNSSGGTLIVLLFTNSKNT